MNVWAGGTLPAIVATIALGCGGESAPVGLGEPIKVRTAVFKQGELPGTPQGAPGADPVAGAHLTAIQSISGLAFAGQAGKVISGRTSTDAAAVAVRFAGSGSGYWLQPLGVPDLLNKGELTFEMRIDFAETSPPGNQKLEFVAIDGAGAGGSRSELSLCVDGVVPDNFNVCAPNVPPPAAVISLDWDTVADLDLQITTPDGKVVDAKHPNTVGVGATATQIAEGGHLDRDAQTGCRATGPRRENLIWQQPPVPGGYQIRVNLFEACGASSARFAVTLYTSQPDEAGASQLVRGPRTAGTLLAISANGDRTPGLYVGAIDL